MKQALTLETVTRFVFKAGPVEIDRNVSRYDFERWIADDLARIAATANEALQVAGVSPAQITRVFMTGGSALVPAVRATFARKFGVDSSVAMSFRQWRRGWR